MEARRVINFFKISTVRIRILDRSYDKHHVVENAASASAAGFVQQEVYLTSWLSCTDAYMEQFGRHTGLSMETF